jgi:hypothetical protein
MKKIILFAILSFGFFATYAQCDISADINMETHTKECQACYKKIVYPKMSKKLYWSSCPEDEKSGYYSKINAFCNYTYSQSYLAVYNYNKVIELRGLGNSKCIESNSGKHLWKEIQVKSQVVMSRMRIENLETDFYNELWNEMSKKQPETFYMLNYVLTTFSDLDRL